MLLVCGTGASTCTLFPRRPRVCVDRGKVWVFWLPGDGLLSPLVDRNGGEHAPAMRRARPIIAMRFRFGESTRWTRWIRSMGIIKNFIWNALLILYIRWKLWIIKNGSCIFNQMQLFTDYTNEIQQILMHIIHYFVFGMWHGGLSHRWKKTFESCAKRQWNCTFSLENLQKFHNPTRNIFDFFH